MRWIFCIAMAASAQSLHVYSEFARIDASGEVTAPAHPREILSPAVVRNGFTSFQVTVQVPKGMSYLLYVGQNPEDALRVTIYRKSGEKLERVKLPFDGSSTEIFWMDLWADRGAPVRRIKIEPEVSTGNDWVTYPMEVRVVDAVVPDSATTVNSVRTVACGTTAPRASTDLSRMRSRNGGQDVAMATRVPREELRRIAACETPEPSDPEWYFRIRDYLFRLH